MGLTIWSPGHGAQAPRLLFVAVPLQVTGTDRLGVSYQEEGTWDRERV